MKSIGSVWHVSYNPITNSDHFVDFHNTSITTNINSKPVGSNAYMLLLHSGVSRSRLSVANRRTLHKVVGQHVTTNGPALVFLAGKHDPFSALAKWTEFKLVEGQSHLYATVSALTHPCFAHMCQVLLPSSVLFELGDHADDAVAIESAKRKQQVPLDEVFDDCGDDTSQLELPEEVMFTYFDTYDDFQPIDLNDCSYDGLTSWNFPGSDGNTCPECSPAVNTFDTLTSALCFLQITANVGQDDLVEVFGGEGGVTRLAIKRKLKSGGNLDLVSGCDLSKQSDIQTLLKYLRKAKPLVVVLAPPCTAFGPWSNFNKTHAPETYAKSRKLGLPLARLAAQIAQIQLDAGLEFICENPWASELWRLPEWVKILSDPRCCSIS